MDSDISRQLEIERERQRVTNAYHRVFQSEDGQLVLNDIKRYFRTNAPIFIFKQSALDAAIRDGQRQVVLRIEDQLSRVVTGDGNMESPKTKVIK